MLGKQQQTFAKKSLKSFDKQHIWLIGASYGIGAELAKQLAAEGAFLALSARTEKALTRLRDELPGTGHLVLPLDVSQPETITQAFDKIKEQWGKIDRCIYNTGISDASRATNLNLKSAEEIIDVNVLGAFRIISYVIPLMRKVQRGHLVFVASAAGYRGLPFALAYGVSKAALIHLAESLYLELASYQITVSVINPGFIKTRMTAGNRFNMPALIAAPEAAKHICNGLKKGAFDINFPKRMTLIVKFLRLLPYSWYFALINRYSRRS